MKLNELFRHLHLRSSSCTTQADQDSPSFGISSIPTNHTQVGTIGELPGANSNPVLKLDTPQLARGRDAVAAVQQKTYQRIQRIHADRISVISRYAAIRADGRPAEKTALVRMFKSLELQIEKQEQFHADLMNWNQLLDNLLMIHEFAVLREQVKAGALAGMNLSALRELLDVASAWELDERSLVTGLNQDMQRNDADAALQIQAEYADAEHELNKLSESEYQQIIKNKKDFSEGLAARIEKISKSTDVQTGNVMSFFEASKQANERR